MMIEGLISSVIAPILSWLLPIEDINMKTTIILPLSQLIATGLVSCAFIFSYFNSIIRIFNNNKYVIIKNDNPSYKRLIEYFYKNYTDSMKGCYISSYHGKNIMMIDTLSKQNISETFMDYRINISFVNTSNPKSKSKDDDTISTTEKNIQFISKAPISIIENYINSLLKTCNTKISNKISIYTLDTHTNKKHDDIKWNCKQVKLCKNISNTIVSAEVKKTFYDDVDQFMNDEAIYGMRGLPYKRGYILHGEPGTGKTSLIKAVANEYQLPIFIIDLSIIRSNDFLVKSVSSINHYIGLDQKYLLIFEDVDRARLFSDRWSTSITVDCFLNVLDGIDESYGRITIMTTNDLEILKKMNSMIRPGRVDRLVKVTHCTNEQIVAILKFYHPTFNFKIHDQVKITPAVLTQILLIFTDPQYIQNFINHHKDFLKADLSEFVTDIPNKDKNKKNDIDDPTENEECDEFGILGTCSNNKKGQDQKLLREEQKMKRMMKNHKNMIIDIQTLEKTLDNTNRKKRLELEKKKLNAELLSIKMDEYKNSLLKTKDKEAINITKEDIGLDEVLKEIHKEYYYYSDTSDNDE